MVSTAELLKQKGIKPSVQRVQIFDYLKDRKDHPTVDMIFSDLEQQLPTLSKTTVYNTLKSFVQVGLAQPLMIEENQIRFDPDMKTHGHFKCESCGNIFDFTADFSKFDSPEIKNLQISQKHLYVMGTCDDCMRQAAVGEQN